MATISYFRNADNLKEFSPGEVIFRDGDEADVMFVVVTGEVDIRKGEQSIDTLSEGQIFGEMALIDHSPRSATAVAKTACSLAPVDEKRFMYMVQNTPHFAIQVMRVMAERLRRLASA